MSDLLSHAAMAKRLSMSPNGLRKHVEAGNIPVARKEGRQRWYDPAAVLAAYRDNVDRSKIRKSPAAGAVRARAADDREHAAPAAAMPAPAGGDTTQSFNKAKTAEKVFQAKLKEAQYKEKIGQLVSRDEVKALSFEVARTLRDRLLALPAQLAPYVSAEDLPAVTQMIHDLITDLQEAVANIALK